MVVASFAGITFSANLLRGSCRLHAWLDRCYTTTNGLYHRRKLMSLNHWERSKGMLTMPNMDIGPANTDLLDAKKNFPVSGNRFFDIPELDVSGFCHYCLSHSVSLNVFSICQRSPAPETSITFPHAVKSPVRTIVLTRLLLSFNSVCETTSTSALSPKALDTAPK